MRPVSRRSGRRRGNRFGLFLLAFLVMAVAAAASMVRFTGMREGRPAPVAKTAPEARDRAGALVVPVAGIARAAITDTWGQSRAGGARAHQGTDIMAPRGVPVVAVTDGVVEKLFKSGAGGLTVYQRSPDSRLSYYYAHLAAYAPGVAEGMAVKAGQQLGYVGDTGNAGAGNYHLHFAIARMQPGQRWWEGEPVNPYPLLAAPAGRR